jgi:alpha-ketoglutarate-dependent sulfate ester dioxygenase
MAVDAWQHERMTAPTTIDVQPLSVHIGAEIRGVDLTRPLAPEEVQDIRAALLQWKVVFFREQHLDHQQQIAFARHFGELTPGHVVFGSDDTYPEIYSVAKHRKANRHQGQTLVRPWSGWHADITAAINPPAASILRGAIVPPYGGDTQWTSLVAAYNALSPTLRGFLDGLRGIHRFAPPQGAQASQEYDELIRRRTLVSEHPLVRVHPETGERVLYVSPSFLKSIVGLTPRESQQLLELLWEHAVRTEFTVRFKWEPGSMAFWDNRSTAHLAPTDIFDVDFDRQFYRVTLVGDVPVGVDGSPSRAIEGEPIVAV